MSELKAVTGSRENESTESFHIRPEADHQIGKAALDDTNQVHDPCSYQNIRKVKYLLNLSCEVQMKGFLQTLSAKSSIYGLIGLGFLMVVEYRVSLSHVSKNALNLELYVLVLILQHV